MSSVNPEYGTVTFIWSLNQWLKSKEYISFLKPISALLCSIIVVFLTKKKLTLFL